MSTRPSRIGGNERNAGAGLFFTKSIASISQSMFLLYSGDAAYRLMKGPSNRNVELHANPEADQHKFHEGLPYWPGTVVGIDIKVSEGTDFSQLLQEIRSAYQLNAKKRKDYARKIRFS